MGRRKMDSDLHRIKLETGTVYQTSKGGNYYFRYQINGERKCVSLKTANQEEALRKAKALLPTVQATELEVIASHVKVARKLAAKVKTLPLSQVWEVYSQHPQRAVPSTVREHLLYKSTLEDFIRFVGKSATNFVQISETHTMAFADHLRTLQISVSTHNRKVKFLKNNPGLGCYVKLGAACEAVNPQLPTELAAYPTDLKKFDKDKLCVFELYSYLLTKQTFLQYPLSLEDRNLTDNVCP